MVAHLHTKRRGFHRSRRIWWVLLLASMLLELQAQRSPFDPVWTSEAAQIQEEVNCFTDRSLYMCEELIQFRAEVSLSGPTGNGPWSTVLYVELVSADGRALAQGKYPVSNSLSFGEIRIPQALLSGNYYLRCYTRWMRNRGPEFFCYLPVRIINPRRSDLDQPSSEEKTQLLIPDSALIERNMDFREHASFYERGDSIALELLFSGGPFLDRLGGCLSVVALGAVPSTRHYSVRGTGAEFRVNFLPDRYGPSLSGTVQYPGGIQNPGEPDEGLPPVLIHFTLMSDVSGYLVCRSDSLGKFTVGLPKRSGKLEIFIQPEGPGNIDLEVRIDQDFDPRHIQFPYSPFTLTDSEMKWAEIMARNVQLSTIYTQSDSLVSQSSGNKTETFYGTPTRTVDLDQYVLLPTLREVFINLVPDVTPHTRRGKTSLLIESENPSFSLYESLVMVDQVPVLNMEQFMSLSPAKIKQIDVIEDVYVRGDLRYGGVINLISRDRDMAGIDLPEHSFFIDYMAMQPRIEPQQSAGMKDDQMPDMHNTVLWMPELFLRKGSSSTIAFTAPEYPGEYVVLFRGQNEEGELVKAETRFKVR